MALFGKKKKKEEPESLGFGFPAAEKRKEIEGVTSFNQNMPPAPPKTAAPEQPAPTTPKTAMPAPPPAMPTPAPIEAPAATAAPAIPAKPTGPTLEKRPVVPMAMPEEIQAPRAPSIQRLRPHVFLKISKYKEVMGSIDKIMAHVKDLKKSLSNMKEIEEKESMKIKESEALLVKLEQVATTFDKIFSSPEK